MPRLNKTRRLRNNNQTVQQQHIDQQILSLHKAMGEKLLANHHYISQVVNTIQVRYESGKMRHGAYLFWSSLLEYIEHPTLFMTTLLENSPTVTKYRRQTPLVGILTEEERQEVINRQIGSLSIY